MKNLQITSTAFKHNGVIPKKYTCQGKDINPRIKIAGVPKEAKSLALIVDDPDAPMGIWDHWVVWNINPKTTSIDENSTPDGAVVGLNSWKKNEYGGPCPPDGEHRYFFKLYALDTKLELNQQSKKEHLEQAMEKHILAKTELIGLYDKE